MKGSIKYKFYLWLSLIIGLAGCKTVVEKQEPKTNELIQVSVIDALLQGIYDGVLPIAELQKHGNFGIGTFHALNGEMVLINDTVFQILASGEVSKPDPNVTTPFAAVTAFSVDTAFVLAGLGFDSLKADFDSYFPSPNLFYAVRISGKFKSMKTRSVPEQSKPYPALIEVTKNQPEFEFFETSGDVVGFYCPEYAKGINVTGLHLHFLTSDRTGGGHVLLFELESGTLEIDYLREFRMLLPEGGDFLGGNFSIDRSHELEKAEKD